MSQTNNRYSILHVAAEMAPLVKVGGLGDVLGSLPKALNRNGADARILLPLYPGVKENIKKHLYNSVVLPRQIHVALDWRVYSASVIQVDVEGVPVYLLDQPELFTDPKVYPMALNETTMLPFVFLSLAAFELPACTGWKPEFLHAHDWSSAILPIALRWHRYYGRQRDAYDTVLTIHNLAHQGIVESNMLSAWGLSREAFSLDAMEFYGQANILKGAALASDAITTVSPHYSWDIQTEDGGFGLHGVFSDMRGKLLGILNGIDYDVWNAKTDKMLPANFDAGDFSGKAACRRKLFEMCRWEDDGKPLMLFVGRLVQQKGVDIMLNALEWRLLSDTCRAIVIGSGMQQYEAWAQQLQKIYPNSFWSFTGFNEEMAHLAYAGADILLMPSLFEPCGLSQMIAMAYGTVPVVRSTGGLADTVIDFDASHDGTGFVFSDYSTDELVQAVYRAVDAYYDKARWGQVVRNAIRADFSWDQSTQAYLGLYEKLRNGDLPG